MHPAVAGMPSRQAAEASRGNDAATTVVAVTAASRPLLASAATAAASQGPIGVMLVEV